MRTKVHLQAGELARRQRPGSARSRYRRQREPDDQHATQQRRRRAAAAGGRRVTRLPSVQLQQQVLRARVGGRDLERGQRLLLGLVLAARPRQRLGEVGVRAGAVERARPPAPRGTSGPPRRTSPAVERQAAERANGRRASNGSTATTRLSAACSRAGSLRGVEQRHQLARRGDVGVVVAGQRLERARRARLVALASSATSAIRACGLSSPVAFGTSAAACSNAAIAASGDRFLQRLAERHLRREAAGIGRRPAPSAASSGMSGFKPSGAASAVRSAAVALVEERVEASSAASSMSTPSAFLIAASVSMPSAYDCTSARSFGWP